MNKLLILTLAIFICVPVSRAQQKSEPVKLDYFSKIPAQIDGCSGLYTYDSTSLKKKRYILVTDLQDLAFININTKQITLKRTSSKELSKNSFKITYEGNGYSIVLITKTIKQSGDELSIEAGTVEITHGTDSITIKVHGETGC